MSVAANAQKMRNEVCFLPLMILHLRQHMAFDSTFRVRNRSGTPETAKATD